MSPEFIAALEDLNIKLASGRLAQSIRLRLKDIGSLVIFNGQATEDTDEARDVDCTLTASFETFRGLLDGNVNPMTAVMLGRLKIKGDMGAAMKLGQLLSA